MIAPSIYFNLPEAEYHADLALGSSDMKRLAMSPTRFWWESRMNPLWTPDKQTPATILGSARHCIAFYGEREFRRRYGRKLENWSTKAGKEEQQDFHEAGLDPLSPEDFDRTLVTKKLIEANPYFASTFAPPIAHEISVFWTSRGVPKKARFDGLKERAIIDLKNIANEKQIDFSRACLRYLHNYQAHIQAEHYREARLAMVSLDMSGEGNTDLIDLCSNSEEWAWVWVFLQKTGAPEVKGLQLTYRELPGGVEMNPIFEAGRRLIDRAEANYLRCMEKFGAKTAWIEPEPILELDASQMNLPSWFLRDADWESVDEQQPEFSRDEKNENGSDRWRRVSDNQHRPDWETWPISTITRMTVFVSKEDFPAYNSRWMPSMPPWRIPARSQRTDNEPGYRNKSCAASKHRGS